MNPLFQSLLPIVLIPAIGYLYSASKNFPLQEVAKINNKILLPCLIFYSMVSRDYQGFNDLALVAATSLIVLLSGALGLGLAKLSGQKSDTVTPSMMFNNCGNIGIPLAMGISKEVGDVAVLIFIVTNLLFSTVGIMIITKSTNLLKIFSTPVFLATVGGLVASQFQLPELKYFFQTVNICGAASPFLMLFCLGVTMRLLKPEEIKFGLWVGGLARPLIGLAATVLVLVLPLPLTPDQKQLFMLFALLPPALLNYQMAPQASAQRVSGLVFFGTLMSLAYIALAMPIIFATTAHSGSLATRLLGQFTGVLP